MNRNDENHSMRRRPARDAQTQADRERDEWRDEGRQRDNPWNNTHQWPSDWQPNHNREDYPLQRSGQENWNPRHTGNPDRDTADNDNSDWYDWDFANDYRTENDFFSDRTRSQSRLSSEEFSGQRYDMDRDPQQSRYTWTGSGEDARPYANARMRPDDEPRGGTFSRQSTRRDRQIGNPRDGAFYQDLDEPINARQWPGWEGDWGLQGDFRGVGPQNYQRADDRILEEICDRLTDHGRIDARDLTVIVQGGIVTLQGRLPNRGMKRLVEDTIDHVSGVVDVRNEVVTPRRDAQRGARWYETRPTQPASEEASLEERRLEAETSPNVPNVQPKRAPNEKTPYPAVGQFASTIQQIQEGMQVVGSDGEPIGKVKTIRESDFQLNRTLGKDRYVPYIVVKSIDTQVHLEIGADEIDRQDWANPGEKPPMDPFL